MIKKLARKPCRKLTWAGFTFPRGGGGVFLKKKKKGGGGGVGFFYFLFGGKVKKKLPPKPWEKPSWGGFFFPGGGGGTEWEKKKKMGWSGFPFSVFSGFLVFLFFFFCFRKCGALQPRIIKSKSKSESESESESRRGGRMEGIFLKWGISFLSLGRCLPRLELLGTESGFFLLSNHVVWKIFTRGGRETESIMYFMFWLIARCLVW